MVCYGIVGFVGCELDNTRNLV